ncbi:MAG: hypothetical protein KIS96_08295 [Bauldia sp.]|nr:hypothetical protein [Bauldia sp.]
MAICIGLLLAALPAQAEITRFGPFAVDSDEPQIIHLAGDIGIDAARAFRAALEAFPDLSVVTLDSNGGATFVAAAIGVEVGRRGMSTAVLSGDGCYSACPLIFFAGESRAALGAIGVHQISFPRGVPLAPEDVQFGVARYLEVLIRLDLHPEVILAAIGTPPDRMHVFTRAEIEEWGIEHEPEIALALLGWAPVPYGQEGARQPR